MREGEPGRELPLEDLLFGDLIVSQGLSSREKVDECLAALRQMIESGVTPFPRLGEVLVQRGYLSVTQLDRTVRVGEAKPLTRRGVVRPERESDLPDEAAEAARTPANLFGNFVLVKQVGQGGFGAVYRAWQRDLGRYVALKFLHSQDPSDVLRFVREAQTAAKLSHPHIVPIYEVGEQQGRHYLAMKYLEGDTLGRPGLEPRRAAEIMRDVATAVQYAHGQGIIHRDLKPHNLMMGGDGHVWVMDFGLARQLKGGTTLTISGAVVGTPAYMPPEQAEGKKCDVRSDIYSLGATLYALLTGLPPFEGETPVEILRKVTESEPVAPRRANPKVHPELETIALKAMEKEAAKRYPTAGEFAEDLRRHLEGEPILAKPTSFIAKGLKRVKRHPLGYAAAAAILLLGLVGSGLLLHSFGLRGEWQKTRTDRDVQVRERRCQLILQAVDSHLNAEGTPGGRFCLDPLGAEKTRPLRYAEMEAMAVEAAEVASDPQSRFLAIYYRGALHLMAGENKEALELLNRAADVQGKREVSGFWLHRGYAREVAGQRDAAIADYDRAAAELNTLVARAALIRAGDLLARDARKAEARERYARALTIESFGFRRDLIRERIAAVGTSD